MQRVGRDVVFPDVPGRRFVLIVGVVERAAHGEGHVQAIGRDGEILDVVAVFGSPIAASVRRRAVISVSGAPGEARSRFHSVAE